MPKIELRIVDVDLLESRQFQAALESICPDTVSVGSESCFRQLPQRAELTRVLKSLSGYRRKLMVPMLFESHFETVYETVAETMRDCEVICVNDYGMLHRLKQRHTDEIACVALGSGVSYSYEECPWHGHIVRDECDAVRKALLRSNIDSGWMYEVLSNIPFQLEVEVPALPGMTASAAELRRHGMSVGVLADWVPVSCSRACHTVRHLGLSVENCKRACNKRADLRPTHRWDFFQDDVQAIRPVVQKQMPELTVWGNMIYVPNPNPDPLSALTRGDTAIFDCRFYETPAHLEAVVSDVRAEFSRRGAA